MELKENDKSSEKSVSGCSEHSAPPNSQMRYQSRSTDEPADDNRVTVKSTPLTGVYNASNYAPNNAANVVSKETFCLLEDSFTSSTKELNDRLMTFLLPPKWMEYQAMAGDMAVPSGLEDSSESESTVTGIEHAGTIHVLTGHENISPGSEQMKLHGGIQDSERNDTEVEHWEPLLGSCSVGVYVVDNRRLLVRHRCPW